MKIERIELYHLRMPLVSPFETSFGRIENRECILIEVYGDGLVGYGECVADRDPGYSYETTNTAWNILSEFIIPSIVRLEILEPGEIHHHVKHVRGHPMAKAGFELAWWDILGKAKGVSLREMIGGDREQVKVGVSVGLQSSPKSLVKVVGEYLEQGYQRVKIKIKPGRDLEDTSAVRLAFPEIPMQVDANSAYSLDTAATLKPLDEMNLLLIEQPLAEDDLWDHTQLQKQFNTPICLDESILSVRHARQALEMGACRVINIKAGRVGGLTQARAIHDFCLGQAVPVWCGGMLETGVGRAANLALASLPGFTLPGDISASARYYTQDITKEQFVLNEDSTISVPAGPGLGVTIDRQALDRYTLRKIAIQP